MSKIEFKNGSTIETFESKNSIRSNGYFYLVDIDQKDTDDTFNEENSLYISLGQLSELLEILHKYDYRVKGANTIEDFISRLKQFNDDLVKYQK